MRSRLLQSLFCAAAIVAVGAVLGLLVNAVSSAGIPLIGKTAAPGRGIGLAAAREIYRAHGVTFIDARGREAYLTGHITGALSVPLTQRARQLDQLRRELPRTRTLVVYCDGGACTSASALSAWLVAQGWRDVRVLNPGFPVWAAAGFPIASGERP